MNGIVLLDEEQQRVLYAPASRGPAPRRSSLPSSSGSVASTQGPRTHFPPYGGKLSSGTISSSPHTHPTRSDALGGIGANMHHGDSAYPMLRPRSDDESGNESEHDSTDANRYAGTSSGLKISVTFIMVGVVVGVLLGVGLSAYSVSSDVAKWVSLPGELFLRALKCVVLPYVFCAVAVAIGDIVFVGKVSVVGYQTFRMFVLFWLSSAVIGMTVALAFRPLFRLGQTGTAVETNLIGFTCANGRVLAANGSAVACIGPANDSSLVSDTAFQILDVHNSFVQSAKSTALTQFTLTTQLIAMITPVVSDNIVFSFKDGNLLSVITFAMVLGAITGRSYFTKTRRVNYLYLLLLQLRNTFFLAMEWIIWLSPVAVISIIAGSFATNQDSLKKFDTVYVYVLAGLVASSIQVLVVFPLIVFILTRCNPYNHMKKMLRAYVFAFACSSSLGTAPVTLTCVKKAKVCSQSLGNFVISIGVCSNLSAVGWYVPIATVFIAESSGNGDQLTVLRLIGIFVLSVISCAGTPPIPSGVLVSVSTFYTSLFGVSVVPQTFAYVVAMDFIVDRLVTVCDVNDDIMCLKVIAENTDETVTQEQLGERE